jgi:hypothetical protein
LLASLKVSHIALALSVSEFADSLENILSELAFPMCRKYWQELTTQEAGHFDDVDWF